MTVGTGERRCHSPAPPVMCGYAWTDDVIDAVGHAFDPTHVCNLTEHGDAIVHRCNCGVPRRVSLDTPPLPQAEYLVGLQARAEALAADSRAHSRRITDRLLAAYDSPNPTEEVVALSPTVEATVTRDPASDAIATATRRMVHRIGQTILQTSETAWRDELPGLEIRIATRLEDVGLSPSTVRRLVDQLVHDVRSTAVLASEAIEERTHQVVMADVSRNLLPRINKVMKETDNG